MLLPFVALLAAIALAPLFFASWWGRHFGKLTAALAAIILICYLPGMGTRARAAQVALDYLGFICLIGSLFIISGGIHINVKGEATPRINVAYLLIGALASNVLGTTGASMLLIRPWLRMNKYRLTAHHVVFFIFIVSNAGGCLTPIGDPPLFLGYLKGVPFWWVAQNCWQIWLVALGILLAMFYLVDRKNFLRAPKEIREMETRHEEWNFQGLNNLGFLGVVLAAIFVHHPPLLREALMAAAATGSYFSTAKAVHESNDFNFGPIREVAILFAGIFVTMMPALDWFQANAAHLGQPSPGSFFWSSGVLSSFLDNAPTYLSFLSVGAGTFAPNDVTSAIVAHVQAHGGDLGIVIGPFAEQIRQAVTAVTHYQLADLNSHVLKPETARIALILGNPFSAICLKALSVGAVFFGANTYIGNGPNFMVKAIADQQKAHTPTFLGYVFKFTLPFMFPMLLVIWLLFFRG